MEAKKTGRPRNVDFVCDQRKSVWSTKGRLNCGEGANIPRKEADVYVKLGLGYIQGGGIGAATLSDLPVESVIESPTPHTQPSAERPDDEGDGGAMV